LSDERGTLVLPPVDHARVIQAEAISTIKSEAEILSNTNTRLSVRALALISQIKAQTKVSQRVRLRLKLLVSAALIVGLLIFGRVNLNQSLSIALHANPWYLCLAALAYVVHIFLNAQRWQMLAAAVGLDKSFKTMVQYYYVGMFFNLFLPSTVGGDISRCYYLSRGSGKFVNSFYSVIADRTAGIAVLFLMAAGAMTWGAGAAVLPWQLKAPIFAGTLLIFGFLPFAPQLSSLVLGQNNWLSRQLNESPAAAYWADRSLIIKCLIRSLFIQLVMVVAHIAIGLAIGLVNVPLWYYLVFYPCVTVLGFVTPSFNGIGIREWAYTYFLSVAGVDRSQALTYAIMWLTYTTLMSLSGGIVYLAGHFKQITPAQLEEMESPV
jgi:glycosyltransferase 2 family protein